MPMTSRTPSTDPSKATVSPSSATFTDCGVTNGTLVTVTPVAAGSTTVSVAITTNGTGGTFALAPATFNVNVSPRPNSAPSVTVGGVTSGADYTKGSVPVATCNVTDAQDGPSSFPATLSLVSGPNAAQGVGSQTASCAHTDNGGLPAVPASVTYNIVPPANAAPTVSISGVTPGDSYTKGSVPTATCDVIDTEDGNSSFA